MNKGDRNHRYNHSAKGQRRNRRYERKHPERRLRWEQARNLLRPGGQPKVAPKSERESDD